MKQAYYFIERDGKQLKTVKELQDWYLNKVKEQTNTNNEFNLPAFIEEERKIVFAILENFEPIDDESKVFNHTLKYYYASFLDTKKRIADFDHNPSNEELIKVINRFSDCLDDVKDDVLKRKFIEQEILRVEAQSLSNLKIMNFAGHDFMKDEFNVNQNFLIYLKEVLTNYQHTATTSAHEPIVAQYAQHYGYVATDGEEVLLPEEIENRLIIETVAYKHALSDKWMTLRPDNEYFKKFIKGTLYNEFTNAIFDRIRPLNNHEINRYLTLSITNFDKFQPAIREQRFIEKYAEAYWHPNQMNGIMESEERTAKFVLNELAPLYHLFKEATEKALQDFKAGLLGTSQQQPFQQPQTLTPALQVQNERMKTSLSVPELALLFKMLSELKPDIFLFDSKEDLFRFISANFATKKSSDEGISVAKLRTLFATPEMKSFAIWEQHFRTMLAEMKKIKEKLSE